MPELPEVETVRRGLAPVMEGKRFAKVEVRRGDLRWPLPKGFAQKLNGKTVQGLGRRAKYLLADLSSGDVLLMHLGMSGSFRVGKSSAPGIYYYERSKSIAHDHVVFHMSNGATVTFNDPRRFGSMKLVSRARLEDEPLLRSLGPEPLGNEFDAAMLAKACAAKKTSLKTALSDQRVVAGLGNIYVCEALFRARLSPKRIASMLADRNGRPNERAEKLVDAIKAVLMDAIEAGGSSLRDHRRADGSLGDFQHNFQVYAREGQPCPSCKGKIKRIVQGGRSTFYCPSCQK
ncbi:MAG TPA: bifunctional DNA-formamidopyrimidine glycosylase/DNA-(apurinic or apyrimidinic site) lyase [Pseudolabrys sp.]|nr:bifunctional DNA-formamidopyrimidine glycosylase/DNA-(apurinic or apyrimidinic site) lyase [Pseudolabrys sp.]